jgi:hypothetical protein
MSFTSHNQTPTVEELMNRKLLIGVTLASVAGTGGAAYATVAGPAEHAPASTSAVPVVTSAESSTSSVNATSTSIASSTSTSTSIASSTSAASSAVPAPVGAAPRTISYQVGDAGTVTIDVADGAMASHELIPATSWSIMAMSNSGTHVAVQFTNSERVVGFAADLVGADVVVSVTNDRLPGAESPAVVDPLSVSVIAGSNDEAPTMSTSPSPSPAAPHPSPLVVPATPATSPPDVPSTPAPSLITAPTPIKPSAASTTAPSSAGAAGDDVNSEHEVHDGTSESHGSESEGGSGD